MFRKKTTDKLQQTLVAEKTTTASTPIEGVGVDVSDSKPSDAKEERMEATPVHPQVTFVAPDDLATQNALVNAALETKAPTFKPIDPKDEVSEATLSPARVDGKGVATRRSGEEKKEEEKELQEKEEKETEKRGAALIATHDESLGQARIQNLSKTKAAMELHAHPPPGVGHALEAPEATEMHAQGVLAPVATEAPAQQPLVAETDATKPQIFTTAPEMLKPSDTKAESGDATVAATQKPSDSRARGSKAAGMVKLTVAAQKKPPVHYESEEEAYQHDSSSDFASKQETDSLGQSLQRESIAKLEAALRKKDMGSIVEAIEDCIQADVSASHPMMSKATVALEAMVLEGTLTQGKAPKPAAHRRKKKEFASSPTSQQLKIPAEGKTVPRPDVAPPLSYPRSRLKKAPIRGRELEKLRLREHITSLPIRIDELFALEGVEEFDRVTFLKCVRRACNLTTKDISDAGVFETFNDIDKDGSGHISADELIDFMFSRGPWTGNDTAVWPSHSELLHHKHIINFENLTLAESRRYELHTVAPSSPPSLASVGAKHAALGNRQWNNHWHRKARPWNDLDVDQSWLSKALEPIEDKGVSIDTVRSIWSLAAHKAAQVAKRKAELRESQRQPPPAPEPEGADGKLKKFSRIGVPTISEEKWMWQPIENACRRAARQEHLRLCPGSELVGASKAHVRKSATPHFHFSPKKRVKPAVVGSVHERHRLGKTTSSCVSTHPQRPEDASVVANAMDAVTISNILEMAQAHISDVSHDDIDTIEQPTQHQGNDIKDDVDLLILASMKFARLKQAQTDAKHKFDHSDL